MTPMKLLVAVDGSEHAKRAVDSAAALARHGGALHAVLIPVRETPTLYAPEMLVDWRALEEAASQQQRKLISEAESYAWDRGLMLGTSRPASGSPALEIVSAAREIRADMIVMGTRGLGAVRSLFIGSVAQHVLHAAPVPVLLAR